MTEIRLQVDDDVGAAMAEMVSAWFTLKQLEAAVMAHGNVMIEWDAAGWIKYATAVDVRRAAHTGSGIRIGEVIAAIVRESPAVAGFRKGHAWELPAAASGDRWDPGALAEWLGDGYRVEIVEGGAP